MFGIINILFSRWRISITKILLNKTNKKQNRTYTITEVVGFFVKVPLLRLQLVIITKSLNKKIHRSFFNPDGD
jgi:hypothetical protein